MSSTVLWGAFPEQVLLAYGAKTNYLIRFDHEWWRFVTPVFIHVNLPHVLINMYSGGKTPLVSTADLRAWGYRIVVWPSHLQRASILAMQRALELLKKEDLSAADDPALMVPFAEREELVGMTEMQALERRFLK